MRRPWQIWLLFTLCLLAVVPPMVWVTTKAVDLERLELAARLQAEQEEMVSSALWRIDARLMPLLAEEAARPDFVYQSFVGNSSLAQLDTSNFLTTAPGHVLLHFELKPEGKAASPQIPRPADKAPITEESCIYEDRLAELVKTVPFERLLAELPEQSLPQLTLLANNFDVNPPVQPQVVANGAQLDNVLAQVPPSQIPDLNPENVGSDAPRQQQVINPRSGRGQGGYSNQLDNDYAFNNRVGKDLQQRNSAYQAVTQRTIEKQQRLNEQAQGRGGPEPPAKENRKPLAIREGISRPVWIDGKLLFAHRVQRGDETVIQGCWLDWPALRAQLLSDVSDLFPQADLVAIRGEEPRMLATLPLRLVVPPPIVESSFWSPVRLALMAVWGCLSLAAGATAWLLLGVITLSERRASFVSAVTHELRTPLTTFRMYAEMLAGDMVTSPEQRQRYLETLCVEADRLTHLVDNVLLYARLERSRPGKNRVSIEVGQMLERFTSRLADRAEQAELKLVVQCDDAISRELITTDPSAVEQIAFNLVDNACKYAVPASNKSLELAVVIRGQNLELSVRDFGPGLSPNARRRLFQPFSKTSEEAAISAPGVGLGLALCKRLAADLGGNLRFLPAEPGAKFILQLPR
jgi:signal transduction histidine kinase